MNHNELVRALKTAHVETMESMVVKRLEKSGLVHTKTCSHFWSAPDEFDRVECAWCGEERISELRHES